jgi:hypothetical protein
VESRPSDLPAKPVFISHAKADRKVADAICTALEARGMACWIATRDVEPGENFGEAIVNSIHCSKVMVLVFSENTNNSNEIKKEVVLAGRSGIPVIPLRVEDVEPKGAYEYELLTRQWIDLFVDWDKAIDRLTHQIKQVTGNKEPLPPQPTFEVETPELPPATTLPPKPSRPPDPPQPAAAPSPQSVPPSGHDTSAPANVASKTAAKPKRLAWFSAPNQPGKRRNYLLPATLGTLVALFIAVGGFILIAGISNGPKPPPTHIHPSLRPVSPVEPEISGEISGNVSSVIDTNAIFVNGTLVNIYGVTDPLDPGSNDQEKYVAAIKTILSGMGNNVHCIPKGISTYQCFIQNQDLGILVLESGMAKTTDEAPPEYQAAEQKAQSAHRGLWALP